MSYDNYPPGCSTQDINDAADRRYEDDDELDDDLDESFPAESEDDDE